jgi:hypothetical protein
MHGNRTDSAEDVPGRTVTLQLSAAKVAYLRALLFEDLQEWAEALAEHAHGAHESGGPVHGIDARDTFRRCVIPELLDDLGWDTNGNVDRICWLERQTRERLTSE